MRTLWQLLAGGKAVFADIRPDEVRSAVSVLNLFGLIRSNVKTATW